MCADSTHPKWSDFVEIDEVRRRGRLLAENTRDEQRKMIKYHHLVATLPGSHESSEGRAADPNPKCHLRLMLDRVCNL
jgi:hypothetical protein